MNKAPARRDLELLSAYLDQQIKAGERQKVEARLRDDAQFRKSYEQLRQTRQLLRSLPVRRAPRNFTLSPAQARISPLQRYIPVFGVASALASFLLIFVIVSDLLFISPRANKTSAVQMESVPQVAMQASPAEKSAVQDYAMETATESALTREAPLGVQLAAPTETPMPPSAAGPLSTSQPEPTLRDQGLTLKSSPLTNTETLTDTAEAAVLGSQPTQAALGERINLATPTAPESATQQPVPANVPGPSQTTGVNSWIRWIEILLLLTAISAGVLFIFARRSLWR